MRTSWLLLAACLALAFAPAPFPRPGKRAADENDLKKLQGAWLRVQLGIGTTPKENNCPITITGTRMQFPVADDAWALTLNPAGKPKTLDARRISNPGSLFRGIYKFEGDSLIICWRGPSADPKRPTDFTAGVEGVWFQVYKRRKP